MITKRHSTFPSHHALSANSSRRICFHSTPCVVVRDVDAVPSEWVGFAEPANFPQRAENLPDSLTSDNRQSRIVSGYQPPSEDSEQTHQVEPETPAIALLGSSNSTMLAGIGARHSGAAAGAARQFSLRSQRQVGILHGPSLSIAADTDRFLSWIALFLCCE